MSEPTTEAGRAMLRDPMYRHAIGHVAAIEVEARADALDVDEVYRDRNLVVQVFAWGMEDAGWHVAWGVDESEPDWPVLYIETPAGQVSWHIPKAERVYEPADRTGSFGSVTWDGHTNEQKADRLRAILDAKP